jgi:hypothetical protein
MLEVGPIQVDPTTGDVPVRTRAMEDLVDRMDRAAGTVRPNLAVRFAADPNEPLSEPARRPAARLHLRRRVCDRMQSGR